MTTGRKRRSDGTTFPRKDGRWGAALTVHGRRETRYAKDQAAAEVVLDEMRADRDADRPVTRATSLGAYLQHWVSFVAEDVRPSTARHYRLVAQTVAKALGSMPIRSLTAQDVDHYLRRLGKDHSATTVDHHRSVLRNAIEQARRWNLVSTNVVRDTKAPNTRRYVPTTLDETQTQRLLDATANDRMYALWRLACTTGMRQGEILGLSWADVDLDLGVVNVRAALQRVDGAFRLVAPKSDESTRIVDLDPPTIETLRRHRLRQAEERLATGHGGAYDALVFTTSTGKAIHGSECLKAWHNALRAAGLPLVRFHDARHAFATIHIDQGTNPAVVSAMLGHSTVAFTMTTYVHVSRKAMKEASQRMDRALRATR